jgi:hypothetical protein
MEKNTAVTIVKVYAVLAWLGALLALIGALAMFGLGSLGGLAMMGGRDGALGGGMFAAMGVVFGIFMLIVAVFDAVVGWGLWTFKPWARIAAVVVSVLNLISFPIGTIIGAIGIWLFGFEPTIKSLFK